MSELPLIYLCRHGQTDWNAERRLQGQSDIPLNGLGRTQAQRNGRYLRNVLGAEAGAFLFLSSPMSRAFDTMRIIRHEIGFPTEEFARDARLAEIHFGDWQGLTLADMQAADAGLYERRERDKWHFVPPGDGAESYETLANRVAPVFAGLPGPAIVTAHGGVTRAFLRRFAGFSEEEAAHIDVPQDRILRFEHGTISWV